MNLTGYIRTRSGCFKSIPPVYEAYEIRAFCQRREITLTEIWTDYAEAHEFDRLNAGLKRALQSVESGISAGLVIYQVSLPLMLSIEYLQPLKPATDLLIVPIVGPSLESNVLMAYSGGILGSGCEAH